MSRRKKLCIVLVSLITMSVISIVGRDAQKTQSGKHLRQNLSGDTKGLATFCDIGEIICRWWSRPINWRPG